MRNRKKIKIERKKQSILRGSAWVEDQNEDQRGQKTKMKNTDKLILCRKAARVEDQNEGQEKGELKFVPCSLLYKIIWQ